MRLGIVLVEIDVIVIEEAFAERAVRVAQAVLVMLSEGGGRNKVSVAVVAQVVSG